MTETIKQLVRRCWFLTGATASGKSDIGLALAERLDAEILSLDSMAIYRGMDIGTAKPDAAARSRVRHHLLDLVDPVESFSVSRYLDEAQEAIQDIHGRGKNVLFVGGTPLYLKALLRGLFEGPPADWEFRQEIEREVERHGVESLHERLKLVDPLAAHKLHPHDKRRLIRALEVFRVTGTPISHLQTHFEDDGPTPTAGVFALRWPRPVLHERINLRVDRMFERGLVDEVRGLLERWKELGHTAGQAVGYREVVRFLTDGDPDLDATRQAVKKRTRQFARRQETWFRALEEVRWVDRLPDESPAAVTERILHEASASP